ncbi:MAG: phosphoribosyltransferase [Candidatus Eremiobacteraeota bacterium]|nr:phosphoribosyltransferase [Candidatus Eremiobacteraeota bacterium]
MLFKDRSEAGRILAGRLTAYAGRDDVAVLGLPRGGVPVAAEAARALQAPLDVFIVRKIGAPQQPELALGAIASGDVQVVNWYAVDALHISEGTFNAIVARERAEIARREREYRDGRALPPLDGKTVILIDDGLATGATMLAAVQALRQLAPARIVVAVPVAAADTCAELRRDVDEIVCAATPEPFYGVGMWYQDFTQTSDTEVRQLLADASRKAG